MTSKAETWRGHLDAWQAATSPSRHIAVNTRWTTPSSCIGSGGSAARTAWCRCTWKSQRPHRRLSVELSLAQGGVACV